MPSTENVSLTASSIRATALLGMLALLCAVAQAQIFGADADISIAQGADAGSANRNGPAALALDRLTSTDGSPDSQPPVFPDAPQDWITSATTLSLANVMPGASHPRLFGNEAALMGMYLKLRPRSDATGEDHRTSMPVEGWTAAKEELDSRSEFRIPRRPYGSESVTDTLAPSHLGFHPGVLGESITSPSGSAGYIPSVITICAVLLFLFALSGLSTVRRQDKVRPLKPKKVRKTARPPQLDQHGGRKI